MTTDNDIFTKNKMDGAYEIGTALLIGRMDDEEREALGGLTASDILVIPGVHDRVEQVLDLTRIPYTLHENSNQGIGDAKFVIVNCPGEWLRGKSRDIRRFVKGGGCLITTDWAVEPLQEIFPEQIRRNGSVTGDECVALDLSENVPIGDTAPVWWLEGSSYPFTTGPATDVVLSSAELFQKYGTGTIATSWNHGQGRVLHMISHFYLQRTDLRSEKEEAGFSDVSTSYGVSKNDLIKSGTFEKSKDVTAGSVNSAMFSANFLMEALSYEGGFDSFSGDEEEKQESVNDS